MPDDSTDGGTDNPAFSHDEDTSSAGRGSESAAGNSSGDERTVHENGNHSFVSKHYVEPRNSPEPNFKTETKIEVPDEGTAQEKPKQNGHHANGNGNNNDVSFLNTTVTSVSNNDVNDKKEQIEAVNLELVSMKPYSGSNNHQAKNQEACEVPADPYEEYFVPVNEHRKFMRGEKLYVTKDKRSTKSHWRKIVCWGCGSLIVAMIAIIAILAGTGVILTQEDTKLLHSDKTSSRQFNDAQPAGSQEYVKNPPSSPPPATSTFPPWPTTDESLYRHVPKALDGVIKLDDLDWNDDINNPKSRVYREVVDDLEKSLVNMLSMNDVMPIVKIHSISKDGEVRFRVSQPVFEKPEDNQNHLEDQFRQTGSAIGRYHVNRLQISSLVDHCHSGSMECSDNCVYDYLETVFICMCPAGKSFDSSRKKCVSDYELAHANFAGTKHEDVQGRSRMPDDMYHPESHDWKDSHYDLHDHYHHHEHTSPEPRSEPVPSVETSNESSPAAEPKAEPETSSEPSPAAKPNAEPESSSEPSPAAEPAAEPEPSSEPSPAAEPAAEPEPSSETSPAAEPNAEPEPSSEPSPAAEPKALPEPSSEPSPAAEPEAEPELSNETSLAAEPNAEPEPSSEPSPAAEPAAEPEPSSETPPAAEPNAEPEPASESSPVAEPKAEPEPSREPSPTAEPAAEPEPSSEPSPAAEPSAEPEPSSEPSPAAEPKAGTEPSSEPSLAAEPKALSEPSSETSPAAEPNAEPEPASAPPPVAEPKAEPETNSEPLPTAEPAAKPESSREPTPTAEPAAEPEPASEQSPKAEPATEPEPSSEPSPAAEPSAEPEPSSEPSPAAEPAAEPEPSSETPPAAEPNAEPEPASESSPVAEPKAEPEPSSEPSPAAEPSAEPEPSSEPSPAAEPKAEPEPSSEPSPAANPNVEIEPSSEPSPSDEAKVSNEPATVIGLNENQHSANKYSKISNETETDITLGKELVKKNSLLDKNERDTQNPQKDVVSASDNNEQSNGRNADTNDSNARNINLSSNIESYKNHQVKDDGERNEVSPEEQFNDITDDFVRKGFEKNDIDLSNEERKFQKIYKENQNINYTKSKVDVDLSDKSVSTKSTAPPTSEATDKHIEDPNVTSQVPILPIEIQLDMSTTENSEKVYPMSQEIDKEIISTTSLPKTTNVEGKTTEQIPILPEELQTTMTNKQDHTEPTLPVEQDRKSNGLVVADHKIEEIKEEKNAKSNENTSTVETMTLKDMVDEDLIEKTTFYNMENRKNESPMKDIKPVVESISDDTTPQTFEYKSFLTTTTEKPELPNGSEEMTDDQLRVIPLEEKDTYVHQPHPKTDDRMKLKKEKELTFETPVDHENANSADRKSSRTVDGDNIPKLTSRGSSDNESNEELKTIFISPDFNSSKPKVVISVNEKKVNSTDQVKYPNFIPVSEEIDESDYHFIEATHSPLDNQHNIATDLPELHSTEEKDKTNEENERDFKESTTELLQAVESSTNKTLLSEISFEKNEADGSKDKNVKEATTRDNKIIANSTTESDLLEVLKIPVSIVTSEPNVLSHSKCKSGQFQCFNGTARDGSYCVDGSSTCDSENDCSDGSDEYDCEREKCPHNFQCASGQCLKRHLVCNGIVECDDGSDEKECSNWKCADDEFQCPNGRCIPVLWQCDGRPDCENHADEYSCSESCGNDEYLCPTEKWCIPQTWRCNGVPECVNGEDEKLCECAVDQFKCETGGCIPAEQSCDGIENCPDRSDEWNCLSGFSKNSSVSTEADKDKENEFSTKSSPVKIRQSNGEQKYICSDGWTDAFSDQYCRSLGFAASESTQFMEVGADKKLLQLISNANTNSSIVLNLEKTDSCKSEKIVEVSCQEFSCGSHESVGPTARLVGGTRATEGQWSSVALLKELKYGTACTASVLSPMHALASYSCIYSNRQSSGWQLFVGGNLLKPNKVKNIVPYPQVKYNQFLYNNDIALVELTEPLTFSRNVSAACLPNQLFQPPQLCVTVGWGFPVNGGVDLQQYLQFLPVPTYDSEECNATIHYAGFITKNNICAGFTDTDKGPCYNDEGAPLMCVSETGRWEIQGLLSHHSRCSRGHPAIYSSLAPALSWLRNSVPALQTHS